MDRKLLNKVRTVLLALMSARGFTHDGRTFFLDDNYALFTKAQMLTPGAGAKECFVRVLGELEVRELIHWAKDLTEEEMFLLNAQRTLTAMQNGEINADQDDNKAADKGT